jgi:hypothetical protein
VGRPSGRWVPRLSLSLTLIVVMAFIGTFTLAIAGRSMDEDVEGSYLIPVAIVLGVIWIAAPLFLLIRWIRGTV